MNKNKDYKRSLQAFEWHEDRMPKKGLKNLKKKDRQKGKKEIKKVIKSEMA